MSDVKVTDSVLYVGCDDLDIDLFESQYHVPNGVSYNSYVILDEKIAIMDTVDPRSRTQPVHQSPDSYCPDCFSDLCE